MNERADDRLNTADMAAAGQGATLERARAARSPGDDARDEDVRGADRVRVRAQPIHGAGEVEERAQSTPLFADDESTRLRTRWEQIQTGFVDEPRRAVEQADELVAQVMKRLAQVFSDERGQLEAQWTRGDDVSTEDLRIALRRYRSFFDRLLSV